MKKSLAAILAVLSMVCTFTACGNETMENSESSSVSESSESSESSAAETTEDSKDESSESKVEVSKAEKKDSDKKVDKHTADEAIEKAAEAREKMNKEREKVSEKFDKIKTEIENGQTADASNEEYIDFMAEFCKATKDGDVDKLLKYCLPDSSYDAMKKVGALDAMLDEIGVADMDMPVNVERDDIKVISVREADEDEIISSERIYSLLDVMYGMMADVGITYDMIMGDAEIPDDVFEAYFERVDELDFASLEDIPITVEFDKYVFVTYSLAGDVEEIAIFRVKGEDIKFDSIQAAGGDDFMDMIF